MDKVTIVDCWSVFNDIIDVCMYTNVSDKSKVERIQNKAFSIVLRLGREYEKYEKDDSNNR